MKNIKKFKILNNNVINTFQNPSNENKKKLKKILSKCSKYVNNNKNNKWIKDIINWYENFTLKPEYRGPDIVPNYGLFLSVVISCINCGLTRPLIDIEAEQFFSYIEEEMLRRNLDKKIRNLTEKHVSEIIFKIINIDPQYYMHHLDKYKTMLYSQNSNDNHSNDDDNDKTLNKFIINRIDVTYPDIKFDVQTHFNEFAKRFYIFEQIKLHDGTIINKSDIFNDCPDFKNNLIYYVQFISYNSKYNSYNGLTRLASYIKNLIFRKNKFRNYAIRHNKYNEILFGNENVKEFFCYIIDKYLSNYIRSERNIIFKEYKKNNIEQLINEFIDSDDVEKCCDILSKITFGGELHLFLKRLKQTDKLYDEKNQLLRTGKYLDQKIIKDFPN